MTLNPVVHFDPMGGLLLVISAISATSGTGFIFGWAKPTPVNPSNLRDRRNGEVLVAIAGPVSNLIMAVIGAIIWRILFATDVALPAILVQVIFSFVAFNIALAIFNLIPVPPLDGSAILFRSRQPADGLAAPADAGPVRADHGHRARRVRWVIPGKVDR